MVALLGPSNILFQHGLYVLHNSIKNSWFTQVRALSQQYSLPDPIQIMISPPPKERFKSDVKTAISSFWRDSLIAEAEHLTSLRYMRLSFLPPTGAWCPPPLLVDLPLLFLSCAVSHSDG